MKEWDFQSLIKTFEGNICRDCRSVRTRFESSSAQQELSRRKQASLRPIIEYFSLRGDTNEIERRLPDLAWAWGMLLHKIELEVDPQKTGPNKFDDIEGWISWAERFAT